MTTYYKATRIDGTDFHSGTVDYAAALASGTRVRVRTPTREKYLTCTEHVLHASDVPTETLVGGAWPCRLFEVAGRPVARKGHKYGFRSLRILREVEAWQALGPQGREIAAMVERASRLAPSEVWRLDDARDDARDAAMVAAAWDAAGYAAMVVAAWAARDAARIAARDAARDAARIGVRYAAAWNPASALVVRDLIGQHPGWDQDAYDVLTGPWRTFIGPLHPDDAP